MTDYSKIFEESLAIEAEEVREAGAGYMARVLAQATMPHSKPSDNEYSRSNGNLTVTMWAPAKVGLPYGSYPRLLLAWLTTEAVRTRKPELELGPTLSGFMKDLGLIPAGGRWGTIHRLRDQMKRLFSASVSCDYSDEERDVGEGFRITKHYNLWWDPKQPEQAALWRSSVTLSQDFFDEIIDRPVPIDLRALNALKKSPLALDIYAWSTYRMSYLRRLAEIPWESLQMQFGAGYPETPRGRRDFKRNFLKALIKVAIVYPDLKAEEGERSLLLRPSRTHVPLKS